MLKAFAVESGCLNRSIRITIAGATRTVEDEKRLYRDYLLRVDFLAARPKKVKLKWSHTC